MSLEDYLPIVGAEAISDIHRKARPLYGRRIVHVNSTYQGGGVAEMLVRLVPLMNDVGLEADWRVIPGTADFFAVTKRFHNGLQGERFELTDEMRSIYLAQSEAFARFADLDRDVVIVHDPQPLPLIRYYRKRQPWIWRCHIDIADPDPALWEFLAPMIMRYDSMIVSSQAYTRPDIGVGQTVFTPAIDPLAPKNADMSADVVQSTLAALGVPADKPYILQVSRFDKWKDMGGVVDAYRQLADDADCRVVLCGSMATDDPEGTEMYTRVVDGAQDLLEAGDLIILRDAADPEVNALQRGAAVVMQKSRREGFGLTVTEAMWKGTAVVATDVGGIPLQIDSGENGILVRPDDTAAFAQAVLGLLRDADLRERLGRAAREKVRSNFLITRLLSDYLDLLHNVLS